MTAAKNILKIVGAALGAFAVALIGAYFALPMMTSGLVANTDVDSSATSNSGRTVAQASPSDTAFASRETEKEAAAPASGQASDATEQMEKEPGKMRSSKTTSKDTTGGTDVRRGIARSTSVTKALRDSIRVLKRRLRQAKKKTAMLQEKADTLRGKLADTKTRSMKASELSSALLDMRRRELSALLKKVNMSVLEKLYERASGRSRTRLLRSMSPERAARFVNQVVEGKPSKASSESPVASSQ